MNLNFSDTESLSSLSAKSAEGPIDDLDKDLFGGLGWESFSDNRFNKIRSEISWNQILHTSQGRF